MMPYSAIKPTPGISAYDHEGEGGEDHTVVKKIVEQHGPATHSVYSHGGGAHQVISTHSDGHVHASTGHPTFGHSIEHIRVAHQA